jgi:hypothetical protein
MMAPHRTWRRVFAGYVTLPRAIVVVILFAGCTTVGFAKKAATRRATFATSRRHRPTRSVLPQ